MVRSTCTVLVLLLVLAQQAGAQQHDRLINRASVSYQHVKKPKAPHPPSHGTDMPVHASPRVITAQNAPQPSATRRLSVASPAPSSGSCPSVYEEVTVSGCPCTVYHGESGAGNSNNTDDLIRTNVCPAGFRCSHSAIESIQLAGWRRPSTEVAVKASAGLLTEPGICVPCQLGEFCPIGTQEDTPTSLSSCDIQAFSVTNPKAESTKRKHRGDQNPLTTTALLSGSCSGVHLCPGGSYCPTPAERKPCEPGRWCPEGSIKSQPCNITGMLVWNPFRRAPGSTNLLLESLVKASASLDGNSCPLNAINPLEGCPAGYFCPTAGQRLPCPAGHFCPGHTSAPVSCPVLGACTSEKGTAPDWSAIGLLLMVLVLLCLLALLEYLRLSGRCRRKAQSQEDDVMQLIEAVGFKMVGTQGGYQVSRAASQPDKPHFRDVLQPAATAFKGATMVRSSRQAIGRALRNVSGHWRQRHVDTQPPAKPAGTNHAVLTVEGVPAPTPRHRGSRGWLAWVHPGKPSAASNGELPTVGGMGAQDIAMKSPFEVARVPSFAGTGSAAPSVMAVDGQADVDADPTEEFVINPRLTLVFRDVWVADIPIEESLAHKAKRRVLGLCRKECPEAAELSYVHGSGVSGSSGRRCRSRQEEMYAKLEEAAASGAFFIVPGVSSRFPHSQLHAIMGPSGCGKTTLCKALAGRVPLNHMVGDVRVLCSSAADNFRAEVELTAAGTAHGAATACNISHMTGFVPQFDQLHETLTVLENLLLAAKLRLPVMGKGQGMAAAAWRHVERQRHREVHKVVGEVMALMGLTKVATKVVGTSTQRLLSGGQRKRVAIAIELVSKPSLLWLDEPTSGLDAAVAYDVIAALKASSQRGMNVLAIMHQPRCSIFEMFDSCLLLGSNGNVVYSGPQHLAQSYMAFLGFYIPPMENLADFLLDVTAGVVPRPGDPDYIPSQLSAMWHKAGGIWLEQQIRKERQLQCPMGTGPLQPTSTLHIAELLPVPPPTVAEPVDWPWRPRDLEALLARFNLIVDSGRDGTMFSGAGFRTNAEASRAHGSSVLSYDGFLAFWDESGIKELLGQEEYAQFIEGLCDDFDMKPDSCITQVHFVQVLKAQLRAAAGAAAGMPEDPLQLLASVHGMPLHTIQQEQNQVSGSEKSADLDDAPATAAAARPDQPSLARKSAFADYSNTPLEELDPCEAAVQRCDAALHGTAAALKQFEAADTAAALEEAEVSAFQAAAAACAATAAHQAAFAQGQPATAASAAGTAPECRTPGQLSRTCSSATAFSNAERGPCAPGMLTCPQARLRQHTLMRQRTLTSRQAGRLPEGMRSGPSARSGPSTTAECAQQLAMQQQQCQQHMQALLRTRKARKAAAAAAAQPAGMRQVSQARMMHTSFTMARQGDRPPCASLQEARARCLDQLGDFLVMQESRQLGSQQLPLQQTWSDMCTVSGMADALQRNGNNASYIVKLPPVPTDAAAAGDRTPSPVTPYNACTSPGAGGAAEAEAAAAAVRSRKLPSVAKQLQTIMLRSSWKEVMCRSALMTDLLLTSVLGLFLGIAQGRNIQPGSSLTWMLITLLAYGCITLVRSTRSYGSERHIYLQQESPAGVSVTAWVFGHQLIDLVGLMLHPMLFFAWMYVLTLTPVPAWSYFTTLAVVGIYTSGLGYLVSLTVNPHNAMISGLAVALLLGGVANGVAPQLWQLESTHPLLWLDFLSYTRWGLQALYISWLIPADGHQAPATATFLSGLGFCGLDPALMQALHTRQTSWDADSSKGTMFNATAISGRQWWNMTSVERADALAEAAAANLESSLPESRQEAAAGAAITQLWQYYNRPYLLEGDCRAAQGTAAAVLVGLGLLSRVLVFVLVKWKVARKAQQ